MLAIHKMEKDKNEQVHVMADQVFRKKRTKNLHKLRKIISSDTNFDKKSGFVDDRIEEDI